MVKVCHIATMTNLGGVEVMLLDYLKNSNNQDVQDYLITFNLCEDLKSELDNLGIRYINISKVKRYDFSYLLKILKFLISNKIDVVHTYNLNANCWGGIPALLAFRKLVMGEHGSTWDKFTIKTKIENVLYRLSNRVTVNSNATKLVLSEVRDIPKNKILLLINGVDFSKLKSLNKKSLLKEYNINHNTLVVGYVGRLSPVKDVYTLIDSFCLVKNKNVVFFIVGGGYVTELREYANQKGVGDRIVFTGYQINVAKFYSMMDVFVSTPVREPYGNTLVEAAFYELPIIASNIDGIQDNLRHMKTGILISPSIEDSNFFNDPKMPHFQIIQNKFMKPKRVSPKEVAKKIDLLLSNKKLRVELGKNAKKEVINRNSINLYVDKLHKLYLKVRSNEKD